MKQFFALLAVCAACLALTISAAPQTLPVLYDSSIEVAAPKVSSAETNRVYKELLRVAGASLKRGCGSNKLFSEPQLDGLARGAFTRKGSSQVAWFFNLCETEIVSGFYSLVIVENERVVHVSSLNLLKIHMLANELYSLRDINLNGIDELALLMVSGADGNPSPETVLTLLEHSDQKLKALGQFQVYEFYSQELTGDTVSDVDWKVYVVKGNPPVFIAMRQDGRGPPVRLTLDKPQLELQNFLVR